MNAPKTRLGVLILLLSGLFLTQCKKDSSNSLTPTPNPVAIADTSIVNRFIFNGLHDYYLWVDQIPTLTNTKYTNKDSLNVLLNKNSDSKAFFQSLLYQYGTVDKWSFIVSDVKQITDWIQGISETMGYDFMLARIGGGNNLFGFVRYVYKGSPAEKAGIKRGDLFMQVNDQQLTISNYQSLLFNVLSYKLSFAQISNNTISLSGRTVTMTAINMQENPIQLDTIVNVNNLKIGYLVYNGFNSDFNIQLNNTFKKFKDAGIDKLVLDLRYNGGGSIQTATYLASMIYSTDNTKLFIKEQYNTAYQKYITDTYGANELNTYFTGTIAKTSTTPDTPINCLNLNQLYVITSDNTASASELLINGLKPYVQVYNVGINTAGKYVGSFTIQDWDRSGNVNPKDTWAMQPIVVKIANSQGVSDYVSGLTPDYTLEEDYTNLIAFADQNETLFKAVLNRIKGIQGAVFTNKSKQLGMTKVFDAQDNRPFSKQMYITPKFPLK